jgi:uncharacterized membrane protein (DUF485 family)
MDDQAMARLRASPAFQELERSRGALGLTLTIVMLVIYFGFVGLVAFAPALMGTPVFGTMTLGFPLGLGVILSAIALTGIYVLRANSTFDALTRQVVEQAR